MQQVLWRGEFVKRRVCSRCGTLSRSKGLSSCNRTGSTTSSIALARGPSKELWACWSSVFKYWSTPPAPPTATTSSPGRITDVWSIDICARLPPFSMTPATTVEASSPTVFFGRSSANPSPNGFWPCGFNFHVQIQKGKKTSSPLYTHAHIFSTSMAENTVFTSGVKHEGLSYTEKLYFVFHQKWCALTTSSFLQSTEIIGS